VDRRRSFIREKLSVKVATPLTDDNSSKNRHTEAARTSKCHRSRGQFDQPLAQKRTYGYRGFTTAPIPACSLLDPRVGGMLRADPSQGTGVDATLSSISGRWLIKASLFFKLAARGTLNGGGNL